MKTCILLFTSVLAVSSCAHHAKKLARSSDRETNSPSVLRTSKLHFPPVPTEDRVNGRNTNAYLASKSANSLERNAFIERHAPTAKSLATKYGLPASVLLAMACVESGYGFTRTAIYAHNYFGIKNQSGRLGDVYQLLGQPNEDGSPNDFALEVVGGDPNRIIFDEPKRRTNRYRVFRNPDAAFEYLAGTLFQNTRY